MRFANRRFRQTLRKLKTRRLSKAKATRKTRKQTHKQKGGGNTLTRTIPNAAIITNPGEPIREEEDVDPESALE
jgi:hypothetical protein